MKHAVSHIHFVGIGGSGMSGIAEVLLQQGYRISGSDRSDSAALQRLRALGVNTHVGHCAEHLQDADAVVASTAVGSDNAELLAARARGIPVLQRAQMLAELMRGRLGIAVAGTHGKTTTTSLVASVLAEGGLDPGFVIGGLLNSAGANARLGGGDCIVVEADESDASFLHLLPAMAVVTNIDADHMETYGHDFAKLQSAFVSFLQRMPFYGRAILCTDDAAVRDIVPRLSCPVVGYGFEQGAQLRAVDVSASGAQMKFTVQRRPRQAAAAPLPDLRVVLNLAGRHNVLNALAAVAAAMELGVSDSAVQAALAGFQGVGRRFQSWGDAALASGGNFALIEDYGHHPVEIAATLAAARGAFAARRLVLAFQPHRYTRTRDCFDDFVRVLGQADKLLLCDVYGAGEEPIAGADSSALARALRAAAPVEVTHVGAVDAMAQGILDAARAGDVVLCMGAGSIGAVPARVLELARRRAAPSTSGGTGSCLRASNRWERLQCSWAGGLPSARSRCCRARACCRRCAAAGSMRTPLIRRSAISENCGVTALRAASSRCTGASARTEPCRARSRCWASPTRDPGSWRRASPWTRS